MILIHFQHLLCDMRFKLTVHSYLPDLHSGFLQSNSLSHYIIKVGTIGILCTYYVLHCTLLLLNFYLYLYGNITNIMILPYKYHYAYFNIRFIIMIHEYLSSCLGSNQVLNDST